MRFTKASGQGGTSRAQSRSLRVCAAEMQKRMRVPVKEVAGKPTETTAMPRSRAMREKAAIFAGWYIISGWKQETEWVSNLLHVLAKICLGAIIANT